MAEVLFALMVWRRGGGGVGCGWGCSATSVDRGA